MAEQGLENMSINMPKSDKLLYIKNNYESIFSWEIYDTSNNEDKRTEVFLRKIDQKLDLVHNGSRKFNLDLFYLNLISSYEMFTDFDHIQAFIKIKDTIRTLRCTQMDTFFDTISDACFHIAYVTQAYIMIHLGLDKDVQKILSNIKPKSKFNKAENAAIYGIKSMVFLEYSPKDNNIGLNLAESARNISGIEMLWINIWLKAKRRKRRSEKKPSFPLRDELDAANKLSTAQTNLEFLTSAASLYAEAAFTLSLRRSHFNLRDSKKYINLAADLIIIVFNSAKNDLKLLYHCLACTNNLPLSSIPKRIIKQIVGTLSKHENYRTQLLLGKYFLKIKDYTTARDYFKKSSLGGSFSASLLLVKAECLISSVDEFPAVQVLRLLYNSCPSKQKRFISTQILLYYMYHENDNKKQLLYSLNTYLNEHALQTNYESELEPFLCLKQQSCARKFLRDIRENIEKLVAHPESKCWSSVDKSTLDKVLSNFANMCNLMSEKDEENNNSETDCVICHTAKACFCLQPCGHQCICKVCWNTLKCKQNNNNSVIMCPLCRTVIDYYLICI